MTFSFTIVQEMKVDGFTHVLANMWIISEDHIYIYHIGEARIFVFGKNSIFYCTAYLVI